MPSNEIPDEIRARIGRDLATVDGASTVTIFVRAADDGHVRLEGSVRSLAAHSTALATARSARGVLHVEDRLEIFL
jgi:osmotically-inducible protein OsmY